MLLLHCVEKVSNQRDGFGGAFLHQPVPRAGHHCLLNVARHHGTIPGSGASITTGRSTLSGCIAAYALAIMFRYRGQPRKRGRTPMRSQRRAYLWPGFSCHSRLRLRRAADAAQVGNDERVVFHQIGGLDRSASEARWQRPYVYRRKVVVDKVAERFFKLIPKAALRYRAEVMALEIRPDHVGGAPLEVIKQYVDNQKNV